MVVEGRLGKRPAEYDPRVVDQNVDRTRLGVDPRLERCNASRVRDVDREAPGCWNAECCNLRGGLGELFLVEVREHDAGTAPCELHRHLQTDALALRL